MPIIHPCCKCNESFALDEEYVSCFIECTRVGSTNIDEIQREKIRKILQNTPSLVIRLREEIQLLKNGLLPKETADRIKRIVLKLARGHAAFELGEAILEIPTSIMFTPLATLSTDQLDKFESPPEFHLLAEVGSRAMQRQIQAGAGAAEWVLVQSGRYRYLTQFDDRKIIRIVISEYLACEVIWGN